MTTTTMVYDAVVAGELTDAEADDLMAEAEAWERDGEIEDLPADFEGMEVMTRDELEGYWEWRMEKEAEDRVERYYEERGWQLHEEHAF